MSVSHKFNSANQDSLNEEFLEAVKAGSVERAAHYLDSGANINVRDISGDTALLFAARKDLTQMALMLIDRKASLDAQGGDGATALILTSKRGDIAVSRALIDHNADISIEDAEGRKPLDYAMRTAMPEMVALFEKPLKKILDRIPSSDLAQALRAQRVNVDDVDPASGDTMLTWAASQKGQEGLAMAFIEAGANLQARNRDGKTPLEVARDVGNSPMQKLLEEAQKHKQPFAAEKRGDLKPMYPTTTVRS